MNTQTRFKRLALALAFAVLITALMPVTAQAAESNFTELLEYGTVNDSGSNMFNFTTTATVELDVPMYSLLKYIDITFVASDNTAPTSVRVRYNSSYYTLTVKQVTTGIYRAYGTLNAYFDSIFIQFNASGTQSYIIESCKVSSVTTSTADANAEVVLNFHDSSFTSTPKNVLVVPAEENNYMPLPYAYQAVLTVKDATEYDYLYVYGSVNYGSINSIRCTYGNTIVPFTVNYMDGEADGSYDSSDYSSLNSYGKYIYAIEIDLTGIERNLNQYCMIYLGGDYISSIGLEFNCQSIAGSVLFAETENATWWHKLTSFFTELFNSDSSEADDFKSDMEGTGQEIQDAQNQLDSVEKPSVEDVPIDPSQYLDPAGTSLATTVFANVFNNSLVLSLSSIALTCALAAFIIF